MEKGGVNDGKRVENFEGVWGTPNLGSGTITTSSAPPLRVPFLGGGGTHVKDGKTHLCPITITNEGASNEKAKKKLQGEKDKKLSQRKSERGRV